MRMRGVGFDAQGERLDVAPVAPAPKIAELHARFVSTLIIGKTTKFCILFWWPQGKWFAPVRFWAILVLGDLGRLGLRFGGR